MLNNKKKLEFSLKLGADAQKKTYPIVGDIEIDHNNNSNVFKLIYICDSHSEEDCKNILNTYFKIFITVIYKIDDITILDSAEITTRTIKK